MATSRTVDPYAPGKAPVAKHVTLGILMLIVAWAICDIAEISTPLLVLVVVTVSLSVVVNTVMNYRNWKKSVELPSLLRKQLAPILRVDLPAGALTTSRHTFGTFLKPGPPRKIVIKTHGLPPMEGETSKKVISMASSLCEVPLVLDTSKSDTGRRIVLKLKKVIKENLTPRQQVERRILEGAVSVFPKDEPKVHCQWDDNQKDEDYLLSVTVKNVDGTELALPGKQRTALIKLTTRLPAGRFVPEVDPRNDQIIFGRSKPLPAMVVATKEHAPLLASHTAYKDFVVPLGVGEDGMQAVWHPKKDAHLLIIGGTGGGKTIAEHGIIQRLAQAGWRTWLVDGKQVEFTGYRNWENIEFLAQTEEEHVRVLKLAHDTMRERYKLMRKGEAKAEDFDPIVVVIDELTSLLEAVKDLYQETKEKGMPAKNPVLGWVANIGRLGRTAKIHLVVGLQRPDANIMGGEARDNFGCRLSVGKLQSKEASMMMWDNPAIGVSVPNIKGRGIAMLPNGSLGQVQGTYSANPDSDHDDYHQGMVEFMRPKVSIYQRINIAEPSLHVDSEDDRIMWSDIVEADLIDENGRTIHHLDPVSSEESKQFRRTGKTTPITETNSTLQTAPSFPEGQALFAYDPLTKLEYGVSLAKILSALAEEIQPKTDKPARMEEREETEHYSRSIPLGRNVSIGEVQPGQSIILEELDEELIVDSYEVDPDDPSIAYVEGYTADGDYIKREVSTTTTVEVFELEAA